MLADRLLGSNRGWLSQQTLFLKSADSLGANLQLNLLTVNNNGLLLKVRFPNLLGVALREADVVAELLAFTGDFTLTHYSFLLIQVLQGYILSVFLC